MAKIQELLLRLKYNCPDIASEKIKSNFLEFFDSLNVKVDILDQRQVFELEDEWKKRKKKLVKKRKKYLGRWAPIKNALWYNKKSHRYLFEPKLQKLFYSKRRAVIEGWRFLGIINSRSLLRKFKYGLIPKGMIFHAVKKKKVLEYSAWE